MTATTLPTAREHAPRCGPVRPSRRSRWRAAALIAVHVAVLAHVAHWRIAGSTVTPVEPSEAAQTLELGYVNAGFLLFGALILSTLVVGRFFCGWACHVVAYQDLCAWLLKKAGLRPRPVRSRLLVWVPLGAAFAMFAWPTIARWIDGAEMPGPFLWHLTTTNLWRTFPGPAIGALTFAVDGFLIVWLLGAKGFCTYGCPYGAVFGAADRVAPGKIRVTDACEGCGHCTATCTSNVRVHEEVALYRMVVDPGCMKCMDCVSVCPKGALYFGFGAPSVAAPKPKRAPRRTFDFTWPEEIAMAATFLVAIYAFRGLYQQIPFLLSIGLAVFAAIAAVVVARLARGRDVTLQRLALRAGGRWRAPGAAALAIAVAFLALTVHSAVVQFHAREGERLLRAAGKESGPARASLATASLEHLQSAERLGLVGVGAQQLQMGAIYRDRGDFAEAERRMRRAIDLDPTLLVPRIELARILRNRGDLAGARALLEDVLRIEPNHPVAKAGLAEMAR